jgi:hypothetical protein
MGLTISPDARIGRNLTPNLTPAKRRNWKNIEDIEETPANKGWIDGGHYRI